jgi:hypothetical protein
MINPNTKQATLVFVIRPVRMVLAPKGFMGEFKLA